MNQNVILILLIGIDLFAFCGTAMAQTRRELRVIDADSRISLPFVALQSLDSGRIQATTSDVEGRFYWTFYGDSAFFEARCVGYGRSTFKFSNSDIKPIITLQRSTTQLQEINVRAGENPAHRIIEEAIRRKNEHEPTFMGAHRCTLYHRFILTIDTSGAAFTDTIRRVPRGDSLYLDSSRYKLAEFARAHDLMLSESLVSRHYIGATQPRDRMLSTRTAGIQSPLFAVFSSQMQNFSVYSNPIQLSELQYVGPLSPGSVRSYRFHLEESRPDGTDTLYVIRFQPYPGITYNGLHGTIYIHSSTYAVQQVTAEPAANPQEASGLRFNQVFRRLPNGRWYPHQTHTNLWLTQAQVNGSKVAGHVFTQYQDVQFDVDKEAKTVLDDTDARQKLDIPKIGLTVLEDATGQPIGFFEPFRPDSLNARDQETYRFIDSLGNTSRLERKIQWGESLLTSKLALFKGQMELNLPEVLSANGWEGLRLGVGLSTGDSLAKRIRVGGYAAYGFGDRTPKFGGYFDVHPDRQRNLRLRITARDDLRVNGGYRFFHAETAFFSTQPDRLIALFNRFFDRERVVALQFRWINLGPWSGEAAFLVGHRQASTGRNGSISNYRFNKHTSGDSPLWPSRAPSFPVSEWSFHIRYAPGETTVRLPNRSYTIQAPTRMPVFSLGYEMGLPLQTDAVRFNRLLIRAERQFGLPRLGDLEAILNLGTAWGPNPLPIQQLLFVRGTGPGSGLFVPHVFQTFDMATFAGNRLASMRDGVAISSGLKAVGDERAGKSGL